MMQLKKLFNLRTHGTDFNKEELVINPEFFPNAKVGDIIEISSPDNNTNYRKLCLEIKTLTPVKGINQQQPQYHITASYTIQALYNHTITSILCLPYAYNGTIILILLIKGTCK